VVLARRLPFTYPTLCCTKILTSPKIRVFSPELCSRLSARHINHLNLLSNSFDTLDSQCNKLATVVGRTEMTVLATVEQFITLSVYLCLQRDAVRVCVARVHLR